MDWPLIRLTLRQVVADLLEIPFDSVAWKGTKEAGELREFPRVDMSVRSLGTVGYDEERRTDPDPDAVAADPKTPQVVINCGVRKLVWTVRIESEDQDDDSIALVYADRFRVRLGRHSTGEKFRAMGLAWADIEDTQILDAPSGSRISSIAAIDVHMNAVENDVDTTPDAGGTIEDVFFASDKLKEVNGTDSPVQATGEVKWS